MTLWLPSNLSSVTLEGWWFLHDATGALADGATTTQIGGNVSQWNDSSGNARHLLQSTTAWQPPYSASGLSPGHPAMSFDGFSKVIGIGSGLGIAAKRVGAFAVVQPGGGVNVDERIVSLSAAGANDFDATGFIPLYAHSATALGMYQAGAAAFLAFTSATTPTMVGGYPDSSATYNNEVDGTLNTSSLSTASSGNNLTLDRLNIGATVQTPGNYWTGRMAEWVLFSGLISTADRQKLEGYLAWNNGTQASLPAGHPYASAAPTISGGGGGAVTRKTFALLGVG